MRRAVGRDNGNIASALMPLDDRTPRRGQAPAQIWAPQILSPIPGGALNVNGRPTPLAKRFGNGFEIGRRVDRVARPSMVEQELEACLGGLRRTRSPKPDSRRSELFQARKTVGDRRRIATLRRIPRHHRAPIDSIIARAGAIAPVAACSTISPSAPTRPVLKSQSSNSGAHRRPSALRT